MFIKTAKPKPVKTAFREWYDSQLSLTAREDFRQRVMDHCNISYSTFQRRLACPMQYSLVEREYIARMANVETSQLFPE